MVHLIYCDDTGKKGEHVIDKILFIITKNLDFKHISFKRSR